MKEENKKKLVKKSIDIESEFIGKPVDPKQKKEKKDDLTDEIRKFLDEPINLDSIKRIMIRLKGPISEYELERSRIFIYGIPKLSNGKKSVGEFLIKIDTHKWSYNYFLGGFFLASLNFFSKERIDESRLKQDLAHALRNWLEDNLNKIFILPD
jgi:hypothetical protein